MNLANSSILDLDFANGSAADIAYVLSDTGDTDLDWISMRGTQSAANGWDPTYGKLSELLLGTITFTSNSFGQAGAPGALAHEVDVGAYYNGSGDTGGSKVYTLNSSSTSSNSVGLDVLTGVFGNYTPVHVTVLSPEPAAVAGLGLCVALASLRRRRCRTS
jgi:hypothetical protein